MLGNCSCFFRLMIYVLVQNLDVQTIIARIRSGSNQLSPEQLWVQTVGKGYQQGINLSYFIYVQYILKSAKAQKAKYQNQYIS